MHEILWTMLLIVPTCFVPTSRYCLYWFEHPLMDDFFSIIKWICRVNKRYQIMFIIYQPTMRMNHFHSMPFFRSITVNLCKNIEKPKCLIIKERSIKIWYMNSRWDPLWSKLAGSESRPGQLRHLSLLHRFFRQKQVLIVEKSVRLVKHLVSSTWAQPPSTLSPVLSENYIIFVCDF